MRGSRPHIPMNIKCTSVAPPRISTPVSKKGGTTIGLYNANIPMHSGMQMCASPTCEV